MKLQELDWDQLLVTNLFPAGVLVSVWSSGVTLSRTAAAGVFSLLALLHQLLLLLHKRNTSGSFLLWNELVGLSSLCLHSGVVWFQMCCSWPQRSEGSTPRRMTDAEVLALWVWGRCLTSSYRTNSSGAPGAACTHHCFIRLDLY